MCLCVCGCVCLSVAVSLSLSLSLSLHLLPSPRLTIGSVGASMPPACLRNITFRDSTMINTFKGIYIKSRSADPGHYAEISDVLCTLVSFGRFFSCLFLRGYPILETLFSPPPGTTIPCPPGCGVVSHPPNGERSTTGTSPWYSCSVGRRSHLPVPPAAPHLPPHPP